MCHQHNLDIARTNLSWCWGSVGSLTSSDRLPLFISKTIPKTCLRFGLKKRVTVIEAGLQGIYLIKFDL